MKKTIIIWTEAYRPFMMGGDVNATIMTEVEVEEKLRVELGEGIYIYALVSPKGKVAVVEEYTGAIVGTDVQQVIADFEAADLKVVTKQLEQAVERRERATNLSNEEFWGMFEKAKG